MSPTQSVRRRSGGTWKGKRSRSRDDRPSALSLRIQCILAILEQGKYEHEQILNVPSPVTSLLLLLLLLLLSFFVLLFLLLQIHAALILRPRRLRAPNRLLTGDGAIDPSSPSRVQRSLVPHVEDRPPSRSAAEYLTGCAVVKFPDWRMSKRIQYILYPATTANHLQLYPCARPPSRWGDPWDMAPGFPPLHSVHSERLAPATDFLEASCSRAAPDTPSLCCPTAVIYVKPDGRRRGPSR
ncbi:hypothetical protein Purlil1_3876 [Purpureocillium lilacinum]|uniref:Uncharacterized protein n=1 Tax=Purpureocillium lilacinum TaxID=33203 RepID=A0ABR0C743_PURLI|nr:hypothetical protein Purlil1_3876 [Purpureocillium lilacinum]